MSLSVKSRPSREEVIRHALQALEMGLIVPAKEWTDEERLAWANEVADGKHRRVPGLMGPEGYCLHEEGWILDVVEYYWWTGSAYLKLEVAGQCDGEAFLPTDQRPWGQIWDVREYNEKKNVYEYRPWYWDSEGGIWRRMTRMNDVEGREGLPQPGHQIGAYHLVKFPDVKWFWDGHSLRNYPHSMLDLGEHDTRHLPEGFLRSLPADARVVYVSAQELALEAVEGGSGNVFVREQAIAAGPERSVFSFLPSLEWNGQTGQINPAQLEHETEYWIYLAGDESAFNVPALPADGEAPATPAWDFRGKLFLGRSEPVNWYLSGSGAGLYARLVGRIETDSTPYASGGPRFRREIEISLLNPAVDLSETYWDYSDFTLEFGDEETLVLKRLDGQKGIMSVARVPYNLGAGRTVSLSDPWIEYDPQEPNPEARIIRRTYPLDMSSQYFIYMSSDAMPWNLNDINPETKLPWVPEDEDSAGNYDPDMDLRLTLFVSPTVPDHGLLDEQWPGSEARLCGQVWTDEHGFFVPSHDLSVIRQKTLPQSSFDSLADIEIVPIDDTEFRICRKKAGSGVVNVGGQLVTTYDEDDLDNVHRCRITDMVQDYTEANLTSPLSDAGPVSSYANGELYLYLGNDRPHWGEFRQRHFFSTSPPAAGRLSRNWPGNQARWICKVEPDSAGSFTGTYISQTIAVSSHSQLFDDEPEKHLVRDDEEPTHETSLSGWGVLWHVQQAAGLACRLEFEDATHVRLDPYAHGNVALPGGAVVSVPSGGLSLEVSGDTGQMYYVYLQEAGLQISATPPDTDLGRCLTLGDGLVVGYLGFAATDTLGGDWCVCSQSQEPERQWSVPIESETTSLELPGLVVPLGTSARLVRSRHTSVEGVFYSDYTAYWRWFAACTTVSVGTSLAANYASESGYHYEVRLTATAELSHEILDVGVHDEAFTLTHSISAEHGTYGYTEAHYLGFDGELKLKRRGQA